MDMVEALWPVYVVSGRYCFVSYSWLLGQGPRQELLLPGLPVLTGHFADFGSKNFSLEQTEIINILSVNYIYRQAYG